MRCAQQRASSARRIVGDAVEELSYVLLIGKAVGRLLDSRSYDVSRGRRGVSRGANQRVCGQALRQRAEVPIPRSGLCGRMLSSTEIHKSGGRSRLAIEALPAAAILRQRRSWRDHLATFCKAALVST